MLITVYWEDQRGSQPKDFGPHALLVACLADETGLDRWALARKVKAIPKKGDSKLRSELEQDAAKACDSGPVVCVFDNDGVRRLFNLSHGACRSEVLAAATAICPKPIAVVLLEDNVEDLLKACLEATGKSEPKAKANPNVRDAVFQRIAAGERSVRDRVRATVPSFDRLVRYVRGCL